MAADDSIDPDDVAALLAVAPEEFVAARTTRVKALKAEGRKAEAAALAKVRKPVRLVWIVGELARRHPDLAGSAAEVAQGLEEAQASGSGVRPLLKRFRDVVGQVAERADEVEGVVDRLEVGLALREVLADPDARDAWVDGRLLTLPGDEDDEAPADELAPRRARKAAATKAAGRKAASRKAAATKATATERASADSDADADADADAERRAAEEEAARVAREEARRLAEEALARTEAEVAETASARDEAAAALTELEDRLAELEARVAEARGTVEEAEAAAADARERHDTATAALDDLGDLGDDPAAPTPARRRRR